MVDPTALGTLLDHARDKVLVLDEQVTVIYANEAVERILGYDRTEFVGVEAFEYVHDADIEPLTELFGAIFSGELSEATTDAKRIETSRRLPRSQATSSTRSTPTIMR